MGSLDEWRHCPRCAAPIAVEGGRAACDACGYVAWASSSPTVSGLVEDDCGRLLLGRRAGEPDRGKWDTPGGFLEEGEDPLDALRRELREETGLEVEPGAYVTTYLDRYGDGAGAGSTLNLVFEARVVAGEPQPADDVAELAWFAPDELPAAEEIAFRNVAPVVHAWGERARGRRPG